MHHLFERENSELLISVTLLTVKFMDRAVGSMPPDDPIPAAEVAAITRLVGASLSLGLSANGRPSEFDQAA